MQTVVVLKGTPDDLAIRLRAIITAGKTIQIVIPTKDNGGYLIVHSA